MTVRVATTQSSPDSEAGARADNTAIAAVRANRVVLPSVGRTQTVEADRGVTAALGASDRHGLGWRIGSGARGADVSGEIATRPAILAAPVEVEDDHHAGSEASELDDCTDEDAREGVRNQLKAGRSRVPDELYLVKLRDLVAETEGVIPSAREVARQLSIGQDRARRLIAMLQTEQERGRATSGSTSGLFN